MALGCSVVELAESLEGGDVQLALLLGRAVGREEQRSAHLSHRTLDLTCTTTHTHTQGQVSVRATRVQGQGEEQSSEEEDAHLELAQSPHESEAKRGGSLLNLLGLCDFGVLLQLLLKRLHARQIPARHSPPQSQRRYIGIRQV
jgi:hypothetical protein